MISLRNVFKRFSSEKAPSYAFPDVSSFQFESVEAEEATEYREQSESESAEITAEENSIEENDKLDSLPEDAIEYASIHAKTIIENARAEAEKILAEAREQASIEAQETRNAARDLGRQEGYAEGVKQALEESTRRQEEEAYRLGGEVQQFLKRAEMALERQLEDNLDDLRDLAIAIAEKVVCISLKSSTEVIGRMIQTALDKRKQTEWVHIYIAECDAKRMGQMPASLMSSISSLSDRVRIIPMSGEEPGTCVIEMPNEIIDASASVQMSNIRNLLSDTHPAENSIINFGL